MYMLHCSRGVYGLEEWHGLDSLEPDGYVCLLPIFLNAHE